MSCREQIAGEGAFSLGMIAEYQASLAFQSPYHFTVGGYVDDPRLTTLPAYGRRVNARQRGMDLR